MRALPPDFNFDVYAMCPDGSGLRRVTDDPAPDFRPVWSPSGRSLLFASLRSGDPDVWLMDADGTDPENLTDDPLALDFRGAWFPNGRRIVFTSGRPAELVFDPLGRPVAGNLDVYVLNLARGTLVNLTAHPAFDARPTVSPNGRLIAFDSDREGHRDIAAGERPAKPVRSSGQFGSGRCHRSSGRRPVCFEIRASMRGPISSSSWNANTKSARPARDSVRWEPD